MSDTKLAFDHSNNASHAGLILHMAGNGTGDDFDGEKRVLYERLNVERRAGALIPLPPDQGRLVIVEVDALQRFLDVKLAGFAGRVATIPVEDAVSCVGVLLNLKDPHPPANGMDTATGEKHRIAGSNLNAMKRISNRTVLNLLLKNVTSDASFQPNKKFRTRFGMGNIPNFRFWLAPEVLSAAGGGMHLQ